MHTCLVQAMFIPSTDAHDTSYFMSRYIWNPEDDHVNGGSDFDDMTDTCSSGSYTCSNVHSEDVSSITINVNTNFLLLYMITIIILTSRQTKGFNMRAQKVKLL